MNQKVCRLLPLLLVICLVTSCAKKTPPPETVATESVTVEETRTAIVIDDEPDLTEEDEEERVVIDGKIQSYLTGEMVDEKIGNRRPLAVMMSNDKQALPQYGINRADVVYEAPVEYPMNRYMALIEDYDDLERIGSVRSCRTYYTYFAREWDAVYAHYGQSTFALPYLDNVDNINGLIQENAFYRSEDKKSPHNAYTSGKKILEYIEKLGYRTEYAKDYAGHFRFAKTGEVIQPDPALSLDAKKAVPGYGYNKPWFEYNEEDGLYYRFQYEEKHMGNEGQIAVRNLIFQYCPVGNYATTDYLNINVHEDGYGFYFTEGRAVPVTVRKDGEFGITHYYMADGTEIRLNPGKTWICIVETRNYENTEIYGADGSRTK